MTVSSYLLLALYSFSSLVSAAAVPGASFEFESHRQQAHRQAVDSLSLHRQAQSDILASALSKSLYWFGDFDVGLSRNLRLLIDTGSTDLILHNGSDIYKPSSHSAKYGTGHFSISYEGVNRAGFGFESINGTTTRDNVTAGRLTVTNQPQGLVTNFKYADVPQLPYAGRGQGIIGFAGPSQSHFHPRSNSWFWNLCANKALKTCKLGLLFGTSGKGLTVVGELAKKYLKGNLVVVPESSLVNPGGGYATSADITLDNKVILKNQTVIMDVGTDNIQGPYEATKTILRKLGYQLRELSGPNLFDPKDPVKVVTGYFACDKPPTLGFAFPAEAYLKKGEKSRIFNVSPALWDVFDHGNNNCTSILGGTNALDSVAAGAWLLGQPFFAGHYIDFDITANTIGYGDLKSPSDPAGSR